MSSEHVRIPQAVGVVLLFALLSPSAAWCQKWVNPHFDTHRLDYRDLGYPGVNQIDAENAPITALWAAQNGTVYGATSGKRSCLFLYDRAINKVRPLGTIGEAGGVYHCLAEDSSGKIYIGTGRNMLSATPLTRDFPGGLRAIEEQLWKDIEAPYRDYAGGHLYCYDPAESDAEARMADDPCPVKDLGIPVPGDGIYAMVLHNDPDTAEGALICGISYPNAHFFVYSVASGCTVDVGPLLSRKVYSGPERTWRSVPRGLVSAGGKVYTSGDDGMIVAFDPKSLLRERSVRSAEAEAGKPEKASPNNDAPAAQPVAVSTALASTSARLPGEYWESWNYYGYPVVEQWISLPGFGVFGGTNDGYLFRFDAKTNTVQNLGKPRISRRVRAMSGGHDGKLYMVCGEPEEPCKLYSYDLSGKEGFRDLGVLAVDRSPYYAKRAYQFDAMATGIDGTLFIGESDRRAALFLFLPGSPGFTGGLNPSNPR